MAELPPSPSAVTLHVVSHTHWDREWYLPFQLYRIKLVRLMDRLLAILKDDPTYAYFMLDGQTVVLEDYLEVRPERQAEIAAHIGSGRVLAGPWYILPDEFLVSGEAIIRNLVRGGRIARQFGGSMAAGYVPDPFGQISQLPQLLRGFGLDWAIFWRGVGDVGGTEFAWQGPDGTPVLVTHIRGYANGLPLNSTLAAARSQMRHVLDEWGPRQSTPHILVLNGDDHQFPSPHLPQVLAQLNAELAEVGAQLAHDTLPAYGAAVKQALFGAEAATRALTVEDFATVGMPMQRGEFRTSRDMHLLPGVLSARMWIKQANYAAETLLERWVEPWEALYWALVAHGGTQDAERARELESAAALRDTAWKYLLLNQPHDSICGCSIDAVHDEMRTRYAAVEQLGGELALEALRGVAGQINTAALPLDVDGAGQALIVFNPLAGPRSDMVEVAVRLPARLRHFCLCDDHGAPVPYTIVARRGEELARFDLDAANLEVALAMAADGRINGLVVSDVHLHAGDEAGVVEVDITVSDTGEPDEVLIQSLADAARRMVANGSVRLFRLRGMRPEEVVIRFRASHVPGPGYRSYLLLPDDGAAADDTTSSPASPQPSTPSPRLENEFYVVEADAETGWLTITDKATGLVVTGGNRLVDSGDGGDEYNYCPPAADQEIVGFAAPPRLTRHDTELGSELRIEGTLDLPAGLTADRGGRSAEMVVCAASSVVRLAQGVRRVDIHTTVDNAAADHRLRVLFDVPVQTDHSVAEGTFDVLERPIALPAWDSSWIEQPVSTHPQKAWVAVEDGERGVLLANRGLPEYEVLQQPDGAGVTIALTLLRCVGWLSRDDLATRKGHAGPGLATPGGQCPGVSTFDYALVPFGGSWLAGGAVAEAHSFNVPLRVVADDFHPGVLLPTDTLFILEPDCVVISALKRSADGGGVILRAWNMAATEQEARIVPPPFLRAARLVRLDETPADDAARLLSIPDAPGWRIRLRPREICTVRFEV